MLWATRELQDAAAVWLELKNRLAGTPLVPVLLSGLERQPGRPWDVGAADLAGAVASLPPPLRLGLVAASRSADVPTVVGWTGAANYLPTPALLSCVLRSWEDRFGARLVHLGFDTMHLLVERQVPSHEAALAVAAEHFAFCSENVYQGAGSIRRYAAGLPGAAIWSFWWD